MVIIVNNCYHRSVIHWNIIENLIIFIIFLIVGIRVDVTTKKGSLVTGLLTHASLEKR